MSETQIMKVQDISEQIYKTTLHSPSDITITTISCWLRDNIGALNSKLYATYALDQTQTNITGSAPDFNDKARDIYKKMYEINWYDKQIRSTLSNSVGDVISVTSDGANVRLVNRHEISKSYRALKNEAQEDLNRLINAFNFYII